MLGAEPCKGAHGNQPGDCRVDQSKFKQVTIPLDTVIGEPMTNAINNLNRHFDSDDFFVTGNGNALLVWLREVDLDDLSRAVAGVANSHPGASGLDRIVPAVRGVGSYGLNGRKRLYVGYNRERKVVGRQRKSARRGKYYYARNHRFPDVRNEIPPEFVDRIVCGDSEAVLKAVPSNSIDLVFTSPPYNFGLDYDGQTASGGDAHDWEEYFAKLFRVLDECVRVLVVGGRIVVNVQPLFSDYIPSHHIISSHLMERGLIWKGEILWEKHNYNCKYTAWGSWKSPASPYLKYTWEFVEVFCKGDLRKRGSRRDADIDADSFKEWVVARWAIAPERRMKHFGHPAMFPEELARRVMLLFSFRGDTVLDPFAGVGTTCVVARQNGRQFLGIDVAEDYCATARQRVADVQMELI